LQARKRKRRRGLVIAGLVFLALLAVSAYHGKTVVRIVAGEGELVVEVDDPAIEVIVTQNGTRVVDRTSQREFVLRVKSGQVEFVDPDTGATALTKTFEMKRGGKTRVTATMAEVVAARPREKQVEPAKTTSPDRITPEQRKALEWV